MTSNFKEVDERFDNEFPYYSPEQREQIKNTFHSELEKVRQEAEDNMRKRCVEALPKKMKEYTAEQSRMGFGLSQGFNEAIDQATQNINNLDKGK